MAGFTDMVSVVDTGPLVGLTDSHLPPSFVDTEAVNVKVAPGLIITTDWLGEAAPPMV